MNFVQIRFPIAGAALALLCIFAGVAAPRGLTPALNAVERPGHTRGKALNMYQRARLTSYLSGAAAANPDTLRVIAFQVQFTDTLMGGQPGSNRPPRDSLWFANELQHMADYFDGASRGHLEMPWELDGVLYTMPNGMGYYGNDQTEEIRVVELANTVIEMSDDVIDFSRYDHVFIIHAGAGQETDIGGDSRDQIWSSFYDQSDIDSAFPDSMIAGLPTNDSLNGEPYFVDNFSIVPSDGSQDFLTIGTLGIWAFQIGSRVGLVPLFDSTPENVPDSQGVGNFDLMAFGLFNVNGFVPGFPCAFNRALAGWLEPTLVSPTITPATFRMSDVNTGADTDTVCVKIPITESEYYLVVNRVHDANFDSLFTFGDRDSNLVPENTDSLGGAEFDFFLTDLTNPGLREFDPRYGFEVFKRYAGSGIYIWHVDESVVRETLANGFLPDDFAARKGVDLEEADGVQDLDATGIAAFSLGSHFDSYRAGDGNQNAFTPTSKPSSSANSGARSGIIVENISASAAMMQLTIRLELPYTETRTRFAADTRGQPATPVDITGDGDPEIMVAAVREEIFAFDQTGAELVDGDNNPSTIAPWVVVPGARWTGPPAFGNLDGGNDNEIVVSSTQGIVYAWKGTGVEVADGDNNAGTQGVLYAGQPMPTSPLMLDLAGDGVPEIAIVEAVGVGADTLRLGFITGTGAAIAPTDPTFSAYWPARVTGALAAPLAVAKLGSIDNVPASLGIVSVVVDTVAAQVHVAFTPAAWEGTPSIIGTPFVGAWSSSITVPTGHIPSEFIPSAPAAGDIDGDGDDEIVITTPDGGLYVFEARGDGVVTPNVTHLRADHPSAPALGDLDLDGTMEIAVWDADFMYVLKSNGAVATNWPLAIIAASQGEQPPRDLRRERESASIADITGDGHIEVVFPLEDGSRRAYRVDASPAVGFPRVGAAATSATTSVASLDGTSLSIVGSSSLFAIKGIDAVVDTVDTVDEATLSIQTLPGSRSDGRRFWAHYQSDPGRQGRVTESVTGAEDSRPFLAESFFLYPNPVVESTIHARITLNRSATVEVAIYNLEGERTFEQTYAANTGSAIDTPFDEAIDVGGLKSGVYFLRLRIDGASEGLIKPFAIRR